VAVEAASDLESLLVVEDDEDGDEVRDEDSTPLPTTAVSVDEEEGVSVTLLSLSFVSVLLKRLEELESDDCGAPDDFGM